MSQSKLYSECFKTSSHDESSLASFGISCAKRYGLNTVAGTEIPKDGNCMIWFSEDQMSKSLLLKLFC